MEKLSTRKIVTFIGGYRKDKETRSSWLIRIAQTVGLSERVTRAAYYEAERASKRTKVKLLEAATKKASENDSELILQLHAIARYLESVDPEMYRADIDAYRRIIARYQDFTRPSLLSPFPSGILDDC